MTTLPAGHSQKHRGRKLSLEQVLAIRAEYKRFSYNRSNKAELALKHRCSRKLIEAIVLRKVWKFSFARADRA